MHHLASCILGGVGARDPRRPLSALLLAGLLVGAGGCRADAPSSRAVSIPAGPPASPARSLAVRLADVPLPTGAVGRIAGPHFVHPGRIRAVAVSADGRLVATGATDASLRVWSATDGAELHGSDARGHLYGAQGVAFRPGAEEVILPAGDRQLRVISTRTWEPARELPLRCRGSLEALAVSPDGVAVAAACNDGLWLQPLGGEDPVAVSGLTRPDAVTWSGDGAFLAVRDATGIAIVDVANRAVVDTIRRDHLMVTRMAFAPRGAVLAYGDLHGGVVRLHDVAARRETASFEVPLGGSALAWSAAGDALAIAHGQLPATIALIDVASGGRRELHPPNRTILALAFSARGPLWVATDQAVRAWDPDADVERIGPAGHTAAIRALAHHPHGRVLASGGDDATIRLWEVGRPGHRVLERPRDGAGAWLGDDPTFAQVAQHEVVGLGWVSPGELASVDGIRSRGVFRVWSPDGGRVLRGARVQDDGVLGMLLAPDRATAYVLGREDGDATRPREPAESQESLRTVETATGATRRAVRIDDDGRALPEERAIAMSRDGRRIAVSTDDHLLVIDAATGATVRTFDDHLEQGAALSPDGSLVAAAMGGQLDLWHVDEPEPRASWSLHPMEEDLTVIAFAADGATILAGSEAGAVSVIDVGETDRPRVRWRGHRGAVRAIALAPDGETFTTAGDDGQILIWPLAIDGAPSDRDTDPAP